MLLSTDFRKPLAQLCLNDKASVRSVLLDMLNELTLSSLPLISSYIYIYIFFF